MKKFDLKLIIAFISVILCVVMMIIFSINHKPKTEPTSSAVYSTRVLIIEKGDTLFDKTIISDTPLKLDSITPHI